eukprot:901914-Amphidinium_carterae.1
MVAKRNELNDLLGVSGWKDCKPPVISHASSSCTKLQHQLCPQPPYLKPLATNHGPRFEIASRSHFYGTEKRILHTNTVQKFSNK